MQGSFDFSQLDLFRHGGWTGVEHDLCRALADGQWQQVRSLLRPWAGRAEAAAYLQLLEFAEAPIRDAGDHLQRLESSIAPLATQCLGRHAPGYCARLWRALAAALHDTAYASAQPRLHASHCHAQAGDWALAAAAIEREPDAPSQGPLLARLAEVRFRLRDFDASLRCWLLLCWQHAETAASAIEDAVYDASLRAHWSRFVDAEPLLSTAEFPAWLLLCTTTARDAIPLGELPDSPGGRAYHAAYRLLASAGGIEERKALAAINPDLLKHYLANRKPQ